MNTIQFNPRQLAFQELFIGTLIYVTVLGFFSDYTTIVEAKSFSTIFFAAIVLEILTYLTFMLKKQIVDWLRPREGALYKIALFFCVWLVMFLSKFVFIGVIGFLFRGHIAIYGFFGILFVVLSVTIAHRLAYKTFLLLGKKTAPKKK